MQHLSLANNYFPLRGICLIILQKKLSRPLIIIFSNTKLKNTKEILFQKQSYTAQRLKNYPIFINLYLFEKLIIGDTINMDMINV